MKKTFITVVIAIILVASGFFVLNEYIYNEKQSDLISEESVEYFQNELTSRGIELVRAHPIEGFDADILLQAFPGLQESDFIHVSSFEGVYSYEGGELTYERTVDQPVTSAERTISTEGYGTLLENVAGRLGVNIDSEQAIIEMIDMLEEEPDTDVSNDNLGGVFLSEEDLSVDVEGGLIWIDLMPFSSGNYYISIAVHMENNSGMNLNGLDVSRAEVVRVSDDVVVGEFQPELALRRYSCNQEEEEYPGNRDNISINNGCEGEINLGFKDYPADLISNIEVGEVFRVRFSFVFENGYYTDTYEAEAIEFIETF